MLKLKKRLSQTFLRDRALVQKLVRESSIDKNDLVIEIGPGDGIITDVLLGQAKQVIGIEIDFDLYKLLKNKYANNENFTLYLGDVLSYPLPRTPYKVFSNIPFAIEGKLIRKLLDNINPPLDSYIVVRRELAERFCGLGGNNLFFASYNPFFEFSIVHKFNGHDFAPATKVSAVLFRFEQRNKPLIHFAERQRYQAFLKEGFGNGQAASQNLRTHYGKGIYYAFERLGVNKDAKPSYISFEKWIELYKLIRNSHKTPNS